MLRLRNFLRFAIVANEGVITGQRKPVGYQQILTGGLGSAVKLTIPTQTVPGVQPGQQIGQALVNIPVGFAIIQNSGTVAVRWRDDGVAPTATVGMVLNAGSELDYAGDPANIQFIQTAAGGQLEVSFYL
jgi:hypothetical protein